MKFDEYQEKLTLLKKLLEFGNTGTPKELAKKLHVSERTARRLIERLKFQDYPITYCRRSNSYILKN
jgi:transcriptional antiterminator